MDKKFIVGVMNDRIAYIDRNTTKDNLDESITRTDEIRNIANLLGVDMDLD